MVKLRWLAVCCSMIAINVYWFTNSLDIIDNFSRNSLMQKISLEADEVLASFLFAVLFCFLLFLYFKKINQNQRIQYESIIANQKPGQERNENFKKNVIDSSGSLKQKMAITDDTISELLAKLSEFEKAQMYIDQNMSLSTLSSMLNTNSKYLSEIIKHHKNKKFKNYINGLRIEYIMQLLFNNPEYREYKISYLAERCGFSSRVVFGVVFKKEKGITPSYFIQNLEKYEKTASNNVIFKH